ADNNFSNSARRGAIVGTPEDEDAYDSAIGSSVLSPLPVMQTTVVSSGLMAPDRINLIAAASVTPPAVSVKIPSVSASVRIAATISSSVDACAVPPCSLI